MAKDMQEKTLAELRALAKARGLAGYSKMHKDELLRALAAARPSTPRRKTATPTASRRSRAAKPKDRPHPRTRKKRRPAPAEPAPHERARTTDARDEEQRIEDAKFVMTPPERVASTADFGRRDRGEDVDRLPALTAPSICLLPQTPEVLYAYWILESGRLQREPDLRLRLSSASAHGSEVLQEMPLTTERGRWYFHVDAGLADCEISLQLGRYRAGGGFEVILQYDLQRLPRSTASGTVDPAWSSSEHDFQEMYGRAGGTLEHGQLRWRTGTSSPSSK